MWMNKRKLLARIANNPKSARFNEVVSILNAFGFHLSRVRGSHHIFVHPDIETPINAQKKKDGTAKTYQVKQAIKIIDGD